MPKNWLVLPVFNEARALPIVVREWLPVLFKLDPDWTICIIDDGSTDTTPAIIQAIAQEYPQILVIRQANQGHGQACIRGYRTALEAGAKWIFQIDSDGQCDPVFFQEFWLKRRAYEALLGYRVSRGDGLGRWIISKVLSTLVVLMTGVWVKDSNSPYRLMSHEALSFALSGMPTEFYLANIWVSIRLCLWGKTQRSGATCWLNIKFRDRIGGSCIKWSYTIRQAKLLFFQLRIAMQLQNKLPPEARHSQGQTNEATQDLKIQSHSGTARKRV